MINTLLLAAKIGNTMINSKSATQIIGRQPSFLINKPVVGIAIIEPKPIHNNKVPKLA